MKYNLSFTAHLTSLFSMMVALTSCSTVVPPHEHAFRADRHALVQTDLNEQVQKHGVVLSLKRGEKLPIKFSAEGNLFNSSGPQTLPIIVQRDCYLFFHPPSFDRSHRFRKFPGSQSFTGLFVSFDGEHYIPVAEAITDGSMKFTVNTSSASGPSGEIKLTFETPP